MALARRVTHILFLFLLISNAVVILFNPFILKLLTRVTGGEVPIAEVTEMQMKNHKIYVGLQEFSTIQLYSDSGKYLGNILTESSGKPFSFDVNDDGSVTVQRGFDIVRKPHYLITDSNRLVVASEFPLVIERIAHNRRFKVLEQPWYMTLLSGSKANYLLNVFCIIILMFTKFRILGRR